jgi:hypothetical protein
MELIITHSGSAHFDELTAVSLILAAYPDREYTIDRRDPTAGELDDPRVWVIDIGGRHEPQNSNFDHHQAIDCPASFVLIADYLGLSDTMSVLSWWDFKDSVDRIGPVRASQAYGAGDYLVNRSPVETWLTALFAAEPQSTLPLLRSLGAHIIEEARRLKIQVDFWKTSTRLVIAGVPTVIGETTDSAGLEEFRRLDQNPPGIVISLDRQSQGWRLMRFDGVTVDFSLISTCPEVAFAHNSGFLAKTKERIAVADLVNLVSKAIVRHGE